MSNCAIVTGASSGIGYEVARQLVDKDWKVLGVATGADDSNVAEGVIAYKADLLEEGIQEKIMAQARDKLGGLDLLVNNAGGSWLGPFADMPTKDVDRVLGLNVRWAGLVDPVAMKGWRRETMIIGLCFGLLLLISLGAHLLWLDLLS